MIQKYVCNDLTKFSVLTVKNNAIYLLFFNKKIGVLLGDKKSIDLIWGLTSSRRATPVFPWQTGMNFFHAKH